MNEYIGNLRLPHYMLLDSSARTAKVDHGRAGGEHVCIYIYICMYVYTYTYMYTYAICVCVCACMCTYIWLFEDIVTLWAKKLA